MISSKNSSSVPTTKAVLTATPTTTTSTTKKEFICNYCQRAFGRLEHLKRHERSHTNEKPFQCPICNATFVRRDMLKRHLKNVHKDIDTDELVIKSDTFKSDFTTSNSAASDASVARRTKSTADIATADLPPMPSVSNICSSDPHYQLPEQSLDSITASSSHLSIPNPLVSRSEDTKQTPNIETKKPSGDSTKNPQSKTTDPSSSSSSPTASSVKNGKPKTKRKSGNGKTSNQFETPSSGSNTKSSCLDLEFLRSSALLGNQQLQELQLQTSPFLHYLNLTNLYQNLSITSNLHHLIDIKTDDFIKILINFAIESLHFGNFEDLLRILIKLNELPLDLNHLLFLNAIISNKNFNFLSSATVGSSYHVSGSSLAHIISGHVNTLMNRLQNLVGLQDIDNVKLIEVYKILSYYKLNHPNKFNFDLKYRYFVENFYAIFKFDFKNELYQLVNFPNVENPNAGNVNLQEILLLTLSNESFYKLLIEDNWMLLKNLRKLQESIASSITTNTVFPDQNISNFQQALTTVLAGEFPHFKHVMTLSFENQLTWKCNFNLICNLNDPAELTLDLNTNQKLEIFESLCVSIIIQTSSSSSAVISSMHTYDGILNLCLDELANRLKQGSEYFSRNFPLLARLLGLFISNPCYHLQFVSKLSDKIIASFKSLPQSSDYKNHLTIPFSLYKALSSTLKYSTPYTVASKRPSISSKSSSSSATISKSSTKRPRERKTSCSSTISNTSTDESTDIKPEKKRSKIKHEKTEIHVKLEKSSEPNITQLSVKSNNLTSNSVTKAPILPDTNYIHRPTSLDMLKLPRLDSILPRNLLSSSSSTSSPHLLVSNSNGSNDYPNISMEKSSSVQHSINLITPPSSSSPPISSARSTLHLNARSLSDVIIQSHHHHCTTGYGTINMLRSSSRNDDDIDAAALSALVQLNGHNNSAASIGSTSCIGTTTATKTKIELERYKL